MDETARPWRVLEDPNPGSSAQHASEAPPSTDATAGPRVRLLGAGLLIAALAATAAILLAVAGSGGSLRFGGGAGSPVGATERPDPDSPRGNQGVTASGGASSTDDPLGGEARLVIDVAGAVRQPGLYELPEGARVADAIEAAGGYGPRVDAARVSFEVNLAARLTDGQLVRIPSRDDPAAPTTTSISGGGATGSTPSGPVDLNSATSAELEALPGIGPATAAKIIAAREERPFRTVDELRARKVLGAATFEKVRQLVTVH
ncbi:MAG TPA: ComEA family DNA-binding protein [Candidatus Limnocylindrales bacterium]